jgi:hypothetical protein
VARPGGGDNGRVSRRGRWLIAAAAVLALALQAGLGVLVWQHTRPRLPALAAVTPVMDRAIASVVAAAGDTAAVAVGDLVPSAACQNTPLAKGSRYVRTADLYTSPGGEDALIGRIAAALPSTEHPARGSRIGAGAAPLSADLGGGVQLQVSEIDQGWVAASAKTGCRDAGRSRPAAGTPPAAVAAAVTGLLAALGTAPASWHTDAVACPTGRIVTVDALSRPTGSGNLPSRLTAQVPAGASRFSSVSNRLAWRTPTGSVIVAASDDGTHITVQQTTTC